MGTIPSRILRVVWIPVLALLLGAQDEELARELPRIPPTAPAEALKTFRLHPGFELRLVASEPWVTDPVDACYDEDGRLYVVEMRGYPYPEEVPTGRVRRLEDTDGDGVFDTATTFLDGLSWPTSIAPYRGGVFVAVPPRLLYARDDSGDGVADVQEVVFSGFGTHNVQALFNSLTWGPDGRIYANGSSNGGQIVSPRRPDDPPVELGQRDFRFDPASWQLEPLSGGGQFGMSFDDWGHRFTCNNSNHIRQIVLPAAYLARNPDYAAPAAITDIAAEGAAAPVFRISGPEPWRVVRTRQRAADPEYRRRLPATELVATGFFTSATGVTIYRGTAFPPEYRGNAFIGDVGGNLVHRKTLAPAGAIFRASRADEGTEFLASTDNWFRPVNFENTPSGTLLILDMYRETIEHPWSIPEPIKKHLDLTSGHDRGRLYELVPTGFASPRRPKLSAASTATLVAHLADPDGWWRETAQRLLIERRDLAGCVPALRQMAAERPNALGRLHALWTLHALGAMRPEDLLPALADPEPRVREQAAALAEAWAADERIQRALVALAHDPDAMVRFQAAFSIGSLDGPQAVEALASIARRDTSDPWTRAAVMSSLRGRAEAMLESLAQDPSFLESGAGQGWVDTLASLAGAAADPARAALLLRRFSSADPGSPRARAVATAMLRAHRRQTGRISDWLANPDLLAKLRPLFAQAVSDLERSDLDPDSATVCLDLLAFAPPEQAIAPLAARLAVQNPSPVQLAAIRALGLQEGPDVAPAILSAWRGLGPNLRREATEALLARPERWGPLLDAIEAREISPADLDPSRLAALRESPDDTLRQRAAAVLGQPPTRADRLALIEAYRPTLAGEANSTRGRDVFRRVCATCHKAEGFGQTVGPDLATVAHRTAEDLLIHVLDPNREVLPQYQSYLVATKDGRSISGLVASETPAAIILRRAEGVEDIVPRDQIEEMVASGVSQMPEGLEKDIDPAAMADLIAYVRSLTPSGGK